MYTSQTEVDVQVLEDSLAFVCEHQSRPVRVLEIGTFNGDTSREIKAWFDRKGVPLEFWGIDQGSHPDFDKGRWPEKPFPEAHFIQGDSAEVFHLVPDGLHLVLVDGCHCVNHVILDTLHYGKKVVVGGLMLFHDTSPEIQQTMKDPHGPDIPEFHNSVLAAHKLMGFPNYEWVLWRDGFMTGAPWGGMMAYRKVEPL